MSDDQQPEELRPIPDGGLKDTMPGWLKRPPAWRSMPSAEQRHERTLPEPDTSEIDPKTLVDVNDLPQWLQIIAARGEVPVPTPDQTVGHALQQIQAVSARSREAEPEPTAAVADEPTVEATPDEPATIGEPEVEKPDSEATATISPQNDDTVAEESSLLSPVMIAFIAILVVVFAVGVYFIL